MIPHLSALTPPVVDSLYGTDRATAQAQPTFLFLVGMPGVGKSSGHAQAVAAGLLPTDGNYATVNLDSLLENMLPFRAASSMAHLLKQRHGDLVRFASLPGYMSKKENLGMFKWYDEAHDALAAADPQTIAKLNRVREAYRPYAGVETNTKLIDINEEAVNRAIQKGVNIVYETTFSAGKDGKVKKFEEIMETIQASGVPYRVAVYFMHGKPAEIYFRTQTRQEYGMPAEAYPFYRYVPTTIDMIGGLQDKMAAAVTAVKKRWGPKGVEFATFENIMVPERVPPMRQPSFSEQRRKIVRAYGWNSSASSAKTRKTMSANRRRSSNRKTQRSRRPGSA